jgi:hypothetical protein
MKKDPGRLRDLFDPADLRTDAGAGLEADSVYYECRKFVSQGQFTDDDGVIRYRAAIELKARCVDATRWPSTSEQGAPGGRPALSAERIRAESGEKPKQPYLFQKTKTDKGVWGTLEREVYCEISVPFRFLPLERRR